MMKRKTAFLIRGGAVLCVSLARFALWVLLLFIYNTSNGAVFIGYRSSGSDLHCVFFLTRYSFEREWCLEQENRR